MLRPPGVDPGEELLVLLGTRMGFDHFLLAEFERALGGSPGTVTLRAVMCIPVEELNKVCLAFNYRATMKVEKWCKKPGIRGCQKANGEWVRLWGDFGTAHYIVGGSITASLKRLGQLGAAPRKGCWHISM